MSSKRPSDEAPPLDFPASAPESEGLARLAHPWIAKLGDYLAFLRSFGDTPTEALRSQSGPRGREFRLSGEENRPPEP